VLLFFYELKFNGFEKLNLISNSKLVIGARFARATKKLRKSGALSFLFIVI